ncbi:unnamed protein product [Closterium sp. Yama58-4]|nr:unnamed protein product [Closterium sp. Yama58-4]
MKQQLCAGFANNVAAKHTPTFIVVMVRSGGSFGDIESGAGGALRSTAYASEQSNEEALSQLEERARLIKELTKDIHGEVQSQNRFLDGMCFILETCFTGLRFFRDSKWTLLEECLLEQWIALRKCSHDSHGNRLDETGRVTAKVTSPYGHQLHWQDSVEEGHFGFTTKETGQYMACFWLPVDHPQEIHSVMVELEWKIGVAAKDWGKIAKKDKLDGIALELRKLDEAVRSIRGEMAYFRKRESDMRDLNEVTNSRVAWLSIVSLLVCVSLAALQLWHLKAFFERKKLL